MTNSEFINQLNRYDSKLYGFAMNLTRDTQDANDLMQETIFRAFKNRAGFRAGSNFKAWISMIMRNTFINWHRKDKRRWGFEKELTNDFSNSPVNSIVGNEGESNQMLEELNEMIKELNDDLRTSFLLRYMGYKYEEIAQKLNLPLGTVKSKIFYAKKQLRAKVRSAYKIEHYSEALL